jgi:hypothetical protein
VEDDQRSGPDLFYWALVTITLAAAIGLLAAGLPQVA